MIIEKCHAGKKSFAAVSDNFLKPVKMNSTYMLVLTVLGG